MDNTKKNSSDAKKAGRTEFADDMNNMDNSTTNKGNNKSNNSNK